jgi:hypothetical protein
MNIINILMSFFVKKEGLPGKAGALPTEQSYG